MYFLNTGSCMTDWEWQRWLLAWPNLHLRFNGAGGVGLCESFVVDVGDDDIHGRHFPSRRHFQRPRYQLLRVVVYLGHLRWLWCFSSSFIF